MERSQMLLPGATESYGSSSMITFLPDMLLKHTYTINYVGLLGRPELGKDLPVHL